VIDYSNFDAAVSVSILSSNQLPHLYKFDHDIFQGENKWITRLFIFLMYHSCVVCLVDFLR